MNTADRSIALMDTALRRRFCFIRDDAKHSLLRGVVVKDGEKSIDIGEMLETINTRIEFYLIENTQLDMHFSDT